MTRDQETFYVSEVSGGEIHRGEVDEHGTEVWLDADDAAEDGGAWQSDWPPTTTTGSTSRVVTTRPNRMRPPDDPDFWIYDDDGDLLAALRVPADDPVFLNDVVVGPDGAGLRHRLGDPHIFRIAREDGDWQATVWADAPGRAPAGGVRSQRHRGRARLPVADRRAERRRRAVALRPGDGGADPDRHRRVDLTFTDGLVVKGDTLVAVRNFPHLLTYLRLDDDATPGRVARRGADRSRPGAHHRRHRRGAPAAGGQSVRRGPPSRDSRWLRGPSGPEALPQYPRALGSPASSAAA